ncbi:MAG: ATP-binding protein [Firmicutes bacterium]|nr:ATP-binding protein [Bacillota bacterium]
MPAEHSTLSLDQEQIFLSWLEFVRRGQTTGILREMTLEGWKRCADLGVNPTELVPAFLSPEELIKRRQRHETLIRVARPHLEYMALTMEGVPFVIALLDADGWVVDILGAPEVLDGGEAYGLCQGACWAEKVNGNNGGGTAIVKDAPVIIVGHEHFKQAYHGWTCLGVPIHGPSGELIGAIDISVPNEYGKAERMIMAMAAVHSIETELAAEKVRQSATLAYRAAHDFKNPLAVIRASAQLIKLYPDTESSLRMLDRIIEQVDALEELANDLVILSATGRTVSRAETHLAEIVRIALHRCENLAGKVEIQAELPPDLPLVLGNERLLARAFQNVIANALQAMEGQGRLAIRVAGAVEAAGVAGAARAAGVAGAALTGRVIVEVEDTGPGIPEEVLPRIFEPFFSNSRQGTGIGLTVAREVVEEIHGGRISIQSRVGEGTKVTMVFPVNA